MAHIPKKALLFYCPYALPLTDVSHINKIADKGCSGQIALEIESGVDSDQTVPQLLGLFGAVDLKSEFKQRFNDMSLAIISNDSHTKQMANQLDCHHENISMQLQIDQLPFNVLFVDFTGYNSQDAWSVIDSLSSQNAKTDTIQCIISPSMNSAGNTDQQWWDSIRPRQSHLMKNGKPLASVQDKTLVYSYLHEGSSRQDSVSAFTETDIKSNGCNNTILAWHLLAEIGHKLGHVPKYGA